VKGLTGLGATLIGTLMDTGMLIDVDHMSAKAIDETIALAKQHGNYPLMVGHGLFGDVHASGKNRHERMRTAAQLDQLRLLGSSVSVMTQDEITDDPRCLHSSVTFKRSYEYAVGKMGGNTAAAIPFAATSTAWRRTWARASVTTLAEGTALSAPRRPRAPAFSILSPSPASVVSIDK
jgi:hypothetical protein